MMENNKSKQPLIYKIVSKTWQLIKLLEKIDAKYQKFLSWRVCCKKREKKIDEIERRIETETRVLDFEKKRW